MGKSNTMTCDLYRFYDADERLLYVGISLHAAHRASEHRGDKAWWNDVARMDIEHLADRAEALEAERRAIVEEGPQFNVIHNGRPAPKTPQIAWICEHCDGLVSDGDGYIGVDWGAAARTRQAHKEFDASLKPWTPVPMSQLRNLPRGPQWYVTHRSCDPHPDRNDYWFDVSRCRTIQEVLSWNDHLFSKSWIEHTDWARFIRQKTAS